MRSNLRRLRSMLLGCMLGLALSVPAWGATRLGLHVTQEELALWQDRMADPVTTINGFTYQSIYTNRILADANAFRSQSHPQGDGYWVGYTGGGCVPGDDQSIHPGSGGTPFGRGNGAWMMRAAFTFLLTGDTSYADPIRTELLNQITQAGTNWANTSKWCYQVLGTGNALEIVPWIARLLLSYDYLLAGGYAGFSAGEKTNIMTWFTQAANLWKSSLQWDMDSQFYRGIWATPQDLTCSQGCSGSTPWLLYFGGPSAQQATYYAFYNQPMNAVTLSMMVGLMADDTTLQAWSAAYITAFVTAGIWDNGAVADFARWRDCTPTCPDSMWGHTAGMLNSLVAVADMYARAGNTSLYDLSVPTQVLGGSGGTVSLRKALVLWAQMANKTTLLYGTSVPGDVGPSTLLSWNTVGNQGDYTDFASMAANLYYNDATIHTAMIRNSQSVNTTSGCRDATVGGCFSGVTAFWADLPFMFGNMEGVVNPYGVTQNAAPILSITTPTSYASTTVAGATVTVSGPATDDVGVTGVTWSCPSCPVTSGSASCTPACGAATTTTTWTITNLGLPANGQTATLTVTASDGTQTAPDTLTIARQDTANLLTELELHFPFNESNGTTTTDASGQGHTGTLQAGATFGAGEAGNGVVLDGATGQVTVPSTLTSPAALTLAGWVNLSGGSESATVINIANAVGLRIDSPTTSRAVTGFYRTGTSWPNLVGSTAFPASGWHHVAYTMDTTRQVVYLDGVVIAMGAGVGSGPNYNTGNTTTSLGRNPIDALWDLQGSLDTIRVYTRALSEVDLTALVAGDNPVEPAIQITAPNSGNDTAVTTSPIATLAGVASDSDGTVTSVAVTCVPSCGSPTVTGLTDWSVASLPLAYGRNVITVTATDDDTLTNSDTITITRYCPTDISSDLELWLALNGDATDGSGAGRNGTPSGGVTWGTGVVGSGAAVFDGTGALTVASLLDTPATITISAWVWATSFPDTTAELVSLGDYAALRVRATEVAGLFYAGSDVWRDTVVTMNLQDGWHHVAFVAMPSLQQLYVDGVAVGTPTTYGDAISYTGLGPTTEMGRWAYSGFDNNYLSGSLDDVRVYGCPQAAAGIQAIENYSEGQSVNLAAPLHLRLAQ